MRLERALVLLTRKDWPTRHRAFLADIAFAGGLASSSDFSRCFRQRCDVAPRAFVRAQILFWTLAATDGHAKNFSLFPERGGTYRLTPLYDALSAWPIIGRGLNKLDEHKVKLAMAVRGKNAHWRTNEIKARHWDAVAKRAGLGDAQAMVGELVEKTPAVLASVSKELPGKFPVHVSDRIFAGLESSAKQLAAG